MQWVYDTLMAQRPCHAPNQSMIMSSRGVQYIPAAQAQSTPRQGGMIFRGEFSATYPGDYKEQDVVVVRSGPNAGTFVCVKNSPNAANNPPVNPDAGGFWVSLSVGGTVGEWL